MKFFEIVEAYKDDIIKSTQDIIKIKSVEGEAKHKMPFGEGPYNALEFALKLSREMGFTTKNLDGYVGYAEMGKGQETVGILVHLDVVPEGEGWTFPPYEGQIHKGKLYGRGAIDNKGPAMAVLYAMKALKESGVSLNRKIRIIFGTNEETDWGCMDYYFKNEKAPDMAFTPDADFPVIYGEKGIIVFDLVKKLNSNGCDDIIIESITGGNAPNMVPDNSEITLITKDSSFVEKRFNNFISRTRYPLSLSKDGNKVKIFSKGISAHGSTPEKGENAITYLMAFLGDLLGEENGLWSFVHMYNQMIGFNHHGEKIGCKLEDDISGKLNFNPGLIAGNKDEIKLSINVRYPINSTAKEVYDGIRGKLEGTGIELIEDDSDMKPLHVPKDNFLVTKLMNVYREQTGDMGSEPITIGGGTYARAMKNAVAFGPCFPGQEDVVHQKDEYISIDHLMKITRIYAHAMYELAK